jgi:hypothetical protein
VCALKLIAAFSYTFLHTERTPYCCKCLGEYDCGPGLNSECAWPWGATENMVWEIGSGALEKGPAVMHFTPVRDSEYLLRIICVCDLRVEFACKHLCR